MREKGDQECKLQKEKRRNKIGVTKGKRLRKKDGYTYLCLGDEN